CGSVDSSGSAGRPFAVSGSMRSLLVAAGLGGVIRPTRMAPQGRGHCRMSPGPYWPVPSGHAAIVGDDLAGTGPVKGRGGVSRGRAADDWRGWGGRRVVLDLLLVVAEVPFGAGRVGRV